MNKFKKPGLGGATRYELPADIELDLIESWEEDGRKSTAELDRKRKREEAEAAKANTLPPWEETQRLAVRCMTTTSASTRDQLMRTLEDIARRVINDVDRGMTDTSSFGCLWPLINAVNPSPEEQGELFRDLLVGRHGTVWETPPLAAPEPRHFLYRDWLPSGCVTLLAGPGGAGKSSIALQVAASLAVGFKRPLPAPEVDNPTGPLAGNPDPIPVVYLDFEEGDMTTLWDRFHALPPHDRQRHIDRLETYQRQGHQMFRARCPNPGSSIWTTEGPTTEMEHLEKVLAEGVKFVVIDNASLAFTGNENARAEVASFLAHLNTLARIHEAGILLIAHPSKAAVQREISGSTQWRNGVRCVWLLDKSPKPRGRPPKDSTRQRWDLKVDKSNYGPVGQTAQLQFQVTASGREWQEVPPSPKKTK